MNCITSEAGNKPFSKAESTIIARIEDYKERVLQGKVACILPPCPGCALASDQFTRHSLRKRRFNVIVAEVVLLVLCVLIRWKCPACGKSMTQYPDFALPYKRYLLSDILQYAERYIEDEEMTYDLLVKKWAAGYERRLNDERLLRASSIHRWITTLGDLPRLIARAIALIHEKQPSIGLARYLAQLSVSGRKHRSEKRRQTLLACRLLLHLERLFNRIFQVSLFAKVASDLAYT